MSWDEDFGIGGFKGKGVFWNGTVYKFAAVIEIKSISTMNSWSFPAFVKSFSDKYESEWNVESVFGRIDPILTYKNTTRKIDLQITVPAFHVGQAYNNWIKINELMQALYPGYKEVDGEWVISTPPLFGIKFHNLAKEVNTGMFLQDFIYGAFTSGLSIDPNVDEGFLFSNNVYTEDWNDKDKAKRLRKLSENYGATGGDGAGLLILPKSYTLNLPFTAVHAMFRGNRSGQLSSLGGPAVSMTEQEAKEFLAPGEESRTELDAKASLERRAMLVEAAERNKSAIMKSQQYKKKIKSGWD